MKTLAFAAITAAALSLGTLDANAQTETDKALGAGAFLQPNGPAQTVASTSSASASHVGARKHLKKAR